MRVREAFEMPADKEEKLRRAQWLEWATIGFMLSIIAVIGLTLGSSQAMKAAWIEDILSLVPPIAFLVAVRFRSKEPNERFPWGYRRAMSIAFLVAALALFAFGAYILVDSVLKLIAAEHPTIGTIEIFGRQIWAGWLMIAALAYSIVPPVILGHLKLPLAKELHEKVLHTDAEMNKADWMTGAAAILGIVGIGYGFWWADAAAAGIISLDIVKDGVQNLKQAVLDLMDEECTIVGEDKKDPLEDLMKSELEKFDWVKKAKVRLREEGDVLTGEAFVVPRDETNLLENLERADEQIRSLDWRIYDVSIVPVRSFENEGNGDGI
jgi:cation diffusion facilitator family transporter